MAVVATGCRHKRNTNYILAVVCLAAAFWFGYDGWFGSYKDKELAKNDGQPTFNLYFNRYVPIPLLAFAVFFVISSARLKSKKIVADENGLILNGENVISYSSFKRIDKRFFDKEGHFTMEYERNGSAKRLKLSDRNYDHLPLLLDELISRTGAAPAGPQENQKET